VLILKLFVVSSGFMLKCATSPVVKYHLGWCFIYKKSCGGKMLNPYP